MAWCFLEQTDWKKFGMDKIGHSKDFSDYFGTEKLEVIRNGKIAKYCSHPESNVP